MTQTYDINRSKSYYKRKTFNILVVDDDIDVANTLKQILEIRGHNVTVVDDGMRCITHCKDKAKHYDIVFMDYHMEGLDGTQVTEIVKSDKEKTLIFAYTGDNSTQAINDFKQVGMNGVIIKPIDISSIELLMNKIETLNTLDLSSIKMIDKRSLHTILIFQ